MLARVKVAGFTDAYIKQNRIRLSFPRSRDSVFAVSRDFSFDRESVIDYFAGFQIAQSFRRELDLVSQRIFSVIIIRDVQLEGFDYLASDAK
jgi:hypothetical protein